MTVMAASEPEILADTTAQKLSRIKAIVAASSGNLVEWYDFYAYAFTSIYFAAAFFPSGDQTSQLLATAGNFCRRVLHAAARWLAVRMDRRRSTAARIRWCCRCS